MEMTVVAGSVMTGLAVETVLDGMTGAVTVCVTGTAFFVVVITFCSVDDFSEPFVAPVAAIAVPSPSRPAAAPEKHRPGFAPIAGFRPSTPSIVERPPVI